MQHDVFAYPAPRLRRAFPFLTVLQADLSAQGRGRIVAPLLPRTQLPGVPGRLMPLVVHDGIEYLVALELMTSLPLSQLRTPLGSIAAWRDDIVRALDWLFTGV